MSSLATRRLGKLALGIGCLIYGSLAIGSALDRMAQRAPQIAPYVPGAMASHALRSEARALVLAGNPRAALAVAEAAVRDAPLNPASTGLLGAARLGTGDLAGADQAFRVAGQLGWREAFTQTYWLDQALRLGDYRVAAMRLDALLRQQPALLNERRLMDPVETTQPGRAALAERLLADPNWLQAYVARFDGVSPQVLILRSLVLGEVAARKGVLGCEAVGPLVERLVLDRAELQAATLWRQHCPGAAETLVFDGNFRAARLEQVRSQFAWTFIGRADTNVLLEPMDKPDGQWVSIDTTSRQQRQFVRQMILVAPGRYQLGWKAQDQDGKPSDLVVASISCSMDPREWAQPRFDPASDRWQAEFTIDRSCPTWWLNLGVSGKTGTARMSQVSLKPIA